MTDCLHNACLGAVLNASLCTWRHPFSCVHLAQHCLRLGIPCHITLPSRVFGSCWVGPLVRPMLVFWLSLDGQTQNGSLQVALSLIWPCHLHDQSDSSYCFPSCILDARNMGQLRTCVTLWALLCPTRVVSHLDHLHLSPDGGLSPKPIISLMVACTIAAAVGIASLSVVLFPPSAFSVGGGPDPTAYGRDSSPDHARPWGLARWGHDPCPEGRSTRHMQLPVDCRFCHAPVEDLVHCLSECPWFEDLRRVVPWMWHFSPGSFRVVAALVDFRHNFTLQFPRDAALM